MGKINVVEFIDKLMLCRNVHVAVVLRRRRCCYRADTVTTTSSVFTVGDVAVAVVFAVVADVVDIVVRWL